MTGENQQEHARALDGTAYNDRIYFPKVHKSHTLDSVDTSMPAIPKAEQKSGIPVGLAQDSAVNKWICIRKPCPIQHVKNPTVKAYLWMS